MGPEEPNLTDVKRRLQASTAALKREIQITKYKLVKSAVKLVTLDHTLIDSSYDLNRDSSEVTSEPE